MYPLLISLLLLFNIIILLWGTYDNNEINDE